MVLFVGCGRNYFEPLKEQVSNPIYLKDSSKSEIVSFTKEIATLKNGNTIPTTRKLPKGFIAIDKELSKNGNILRVKDNN